MLPFDDLIQPECEVETEQDPRTCQPDLTDGGGGNGDGDGDDEDDVVTPPSDDERCADAAFADANPDLCAGYPRLILKPAYAITESGKTVQYKTYLRTGADEQELTLGLTYTSADVEVALIQASSGLATGVQPGIGTIAVAWQNLNAFAQIEVVESCADISANFLLVFDQSFSSSAGFSSSYPSRLAFAKAAAVEFAESLNYSKDKIAVMRFDSTGTIVLNMSQDQAAIVSAINSITVGTPATTLGGAMATASNYLNIAQYNTADRRIIVLFSDGEDNLPYPESFLNIAKNFKEAGGIILVVALRAWGTYFNNLYKIASPGFFLSAYGATEQSTIETLVGIKSFLCAGDCQPEPGTYPTAKLNYTGFINWDVYQGSVDLIGLGIWDVLPGNGLYVDLGGTYKNPGNPVPSPGGLRSKTTFNFVAGETYQFSIKVAGNNVNNSLNEPVKVTIGSLLVETITPTSKTMPFTLYTFEFTPGANASAKIQIEMVSSNNDNVGPLIDDITLENIDTSTVMLADNFDGENPTTVLPGYGYGYGCLETPPGAQGADPTPPPVLE
jgi:uncharacterized membrane protein